MTDITLIPTGSIIGSLSLIVGVFVLIAYKMLYYEPKDKSNKRIFTFLGAEFSIFAGYIITLITFYIMKFSEGLDFYPVSRAIFVIFSILFGVIGTVMLIPITLTLILLFLAGVMDLILGKNGKK